MLLKTYMCYWRFTYIIIIIIIITIIIISKKTYICHQTFT